jgi:hypothetical protein
MSRDSSVGIATRYGLNGPGIESRWRGEIFRTRPDRLWGPLSLLHNGYRVFPGVKWLERGLSHSSPSSTEVKGRVEKYLYSPSGPSWPVLGWNLPLPLPFIYIFLSQRLKDCLYQRESPLCGRRPTELYCSPNLPVWLWGPPSYCVDTGGTIPEVPRQRREFNHPSALYAKVNEWSYTSTPPYALVL